MIIVENISKAQLENELTTDEKQTGKAGLVLVNQTIRNFGIANLIDKHFPSPLTNIGYFASQKIIPATLSLLGGGNTIDDLEIIRKDVGLLSSCGMSRMCSADTFREFLHQETTTSGLEKSLDDIAVQIMKKDKKNTTYTLDTDWTFIPSDKDSATFSYKKEKGYGSLLSFVPELDLSLAQDFKPGNISPADGIEDQLKKAYELAKLSGKKITAFRSDSAGHKKVVFDFCDEKNINFYISLDMNAVVARAIDDIYADKDVWHPVLGNPNQEWTETVYSLSSNKKHFYRMLVLRFKPDNPKLFDKHGYRHHAICTNNDDISPMDWLVFHNGRMTSENYNKELKNGISLLHCPSHSLVANRNYYLIGILAFNFYSIFKNFYAPKEMRSWSLKTFRWQFISVSGRWLMHARKLFYRLINVPRDIYEYYQYIFFKLQVT